MRVIYLGTPDFALQALSAIAKSTHELVAVVTQPDRLGNRHKLTAPPVKELALELGIPVYQYERISREGLEDMQSLKADIMVTCAFGQILSQRILDVCPHGVINIHASLLPKYRGSCPIHYAIINGDQEAGVTIMQTAHDIDSGDIIKSQSLEIGYGETCGELFDRLSELGAKLIVEVLDDIENNRAVWTAQDDTKATHCAMLTKQDGKINFAKTARELDCFVRGMNPWPSAYMTINNEQVKVYKVSKIGGNSDICGVILRASTHDGLIISCGDGAISVDELQFAGSRRMTAKEYLLGHSIEIGTRCD